jgi:hypothetical protein
MIEAHKIVTEVGAIHFFFYFLNRVCSFSVSQKYLYYSKRVFQNFNVQVACPK